MQHTAQDRCDRCPGQGYTTWDIGGLPLTFCGHHTRKYADVLVAKGYQILVDDTIALDQK